jgi:hypothetical protein
MTSRRDDALACVFVALACACVLTGLARLPALTSDEAWVGLFALRLRAHGLFTPHEMNTYTGPLYGWLLRLVFDARGVSVASLRLLGAACNAAAFALVGLNLRRRVGSASAFAWGVLLCSSAYLLLKSRLAWDVYALQPLLLAATFSVLDAPATWWRVWLLCAATLIGVQNHFIYLSVPASLCALYGARVAWLSEDDARPWLRASISALFMGAVVFFIKPRLSDAAWAAQKAWALPLFYLLSPAAAAAARFGGDWDRRFTSPFSSSAQSWPRTMLGLGVLAFTVWHGAPIFQLFAETVVMRRIFSWNAPLLLAAPLWLWSFFLLLTAAWSAFRAWHDRGSLSAHERTLLLWPAAYAAIFILFRNTSSLRYYSPIQFITLASLAAALPRLPRVDRKLAGALAAVAVVSTQYVFWRELRAPEDRAPQYFRIGWHRENSEDFARKDALFAAFDASGACEIAHQERSFTAIPLDFHRASRPKANCDPAVSFDADTCPGCAAPPFYRWSLVKGP